MKQIKPMTPKYLLEVYSGTLGDKKAVIAVAEVVLADLKDKLEIEQNKLPPRQEIPDSIVFDIVEKQKAIFLSFAILAKEHYQQEIIPGDAYEMILSMYAKEINLIWKREGKKR